jgi:YD repeat-containing protein
MDLSFRTAYAQAKELARAQGTIPLLTAGNVQTETRNGSRFVYRYRYDGAGKRVAEYLGPEGAPQTKAKAETAQAEIRDSRILSDYSRDLRKVGFYSADNSALVTVAAMANAGLFAKGAVLVGTHAFGVILNDLGVTTSVTMMTEDVDVARAARIQIAALPKGGFLDLLKQSGLPFHEIPQLKPDRPATSYKARGKKLMVDLLVPTDGEPYAQVALPELGAHATGLPHLGYLLGAPSDSVLIGRDRIVPVAVPGAGRFCLHKLALYSMRKSSDGAKREKDILQAAALIAALNASQDYVIDEAAIALTDELRMLLKPGAKRAIELLAKDYGEAAERLGALA